MNLFLKIKFYVFQNKKTKLFEKFIKNKAK